MAAKWPGWMRIARPMLGMVGAGLLLGLAANFFAVRPLPLLRPLPATAARPLPPAVGEVDADFVAQMLGAPGTLLVDARAAAAYSAGHIPGALSLPLGDFERLFSEQEPRLRRAGLLVVYCSGPTCDDSRDLAARLWHRGLKNLLLFKGGMEEWQGRGHAVEH